MPVQQRLGAWLQTTPGLVVSTALILVLVTSHLIQALLFWTWVFIALGLAGVLLLAAPIIPGG